MEFPIIGDVDGLITKKMQGSRLDNMRKRIPLNVDSEGCSRCIKADYYKMGCTNFMRSIWGGKKDGFVATGVIEIYEERVTNKPDA